MNISEDLFNASNTNDDTCIDLLFQQYKMFVESADKITERRNTANSFFVTLNSILIVFGSAILSNEMPTSINYFWIGIASLAGISIAITWLITIRSYSHLNSAKFKVINEIEKLLPCSPYTVEWKIIKDKNIKPKKYKTFSKLEISIPWVFIVIYFLFFLYSINSIFTLFDLPF